MPCMFYPHPDDKNKTQRLLAHAAVLGCPPYPIAFEFQKLSYETWQGFANESVGILSTLTRHAAYKWEEYHFYSVFTGIAEPQNKNLLAAVYLGNGKGVLVIANQTSRNIKSGEITVHIRNSCFKGKDIIVNVPELKAFEWKFIEFKYQQEEKYQ